MDKKKATELITDRFKDLKDLSSITFYNNPNRFNKFIKEGINPGHKFLVYGQYDKHKIKYKKSGYVKVAKVVLNNIAVLPCTLISTISYYMTTINPTLFLLNLFFCMICLYMIYSLCSLNKTVQHDKNIIHYFYNSFRNIFPTKEF